MSSLLASCRPQTAFVSVGAVGLAATILFLARNPPPRPFQDRLRSLEPKESSIDNDFYDDYFGTSDDSEDADVTRTEGNGTAESKEHPLQLVNHGRMPYFLRTWKQQHLLCAAKDPESEALEVSNATLPPDFKVLDVGCGGGIAAEVVARAGAAVTGVDLSAGAIGCAKRRAKARGLHIQYMVGDALSLPVPSQSYDGVLCSDTLEHLFDLDKALSEIARVLKPGGVLVLDTINRSTLSWYALVLIAQDTLGYLPHGAHDWRMFITPEELRTSLQRAGLEPCPEAAVRGMRPSINLPHVIINRAWQWATSKAGQQSFLDCFIGPWTECKFASGSFLAWARKPM